MLSYVMFPADVCAGVYIIYLSSGCLPALLIKFTVIFYINYYSHWIPMRRDGMGWDGYKSSLRWDVQGQIQKILKGMGSWEKF